MRLLRKCRRLTHTILPKNLTRKVVRGGLHYELNGSEMIHRRLAITGVWEPDQIAFLFNTARQRGADVFLDVGANFGYYSLLAARLGFFDEIHALEPQPESHRQLLRHLAINGFEGKITPHTIAASDIAGQVQIAAGRIGGDDKTGDAVAITAIPLDSLFSFRGRNIAMKMDIEGHESAAIRGAKDLFANNRVLLQVEVWQENASLIADLLALGFSLIHFCGWDFYFIKDANPKGES